MFINETVQNAASLKLTIKVLATLKKCFIGTKHNLLHEGLIYRRAAILRLHLLGALAKVVQTDIH